MLIRAAIGVPALAFAGSARAADLATKFSDGGCGDGDECGEAAGESDLWGDSVNKMHPTSTSFTPTHICGVYIRYEGNGPIIRQGYVRWQASKEEDLILDLLRSLKKPAAPEVNVLYKRYNFDEFNMSSQQVVVIYLDNKPENVRFLTLEDINDDPLTSGQQQSPEERLLEHIVRFARFSGIDRSEVKKNRAFYNIRPIAMPHGEFRGPTAYRLEYYNTDDDGNPWQGVVYNDKSTHKIYSMNIHLLVRSDPAGGGRERMIPTILDPDTGNMGGQP
jgi:hypothetical protein